MKWSPRRVWSLVRHASRTRPEGGSRVLRIKCSQMTHWVAQVHGARFQPTGQPLPSTNAPHPVLGSARLRLNLLNGARTHLAKELFAWATKGEGTRQTQMPRLHGHLSEPRMTPNSSPPRSSRARHDSGHNNGTVGCPTFGFGLCFSLFFLCILLRDKAGTFLFLAALLLHSRWRATPRTDTTVETAAVRLIVQPWKQRGTAAMMPTAMCAARQQSRACTHHCSRRYSELPCLLSP